MALDQVVGDVAARAVRWLDAALTRFARTSTGEVVEFIEFLAPGQLQPSISLASPMLPSTRVLRAPNSAAVARRTQACTRPSCPPAQRFTSRQTKVAERALLMPLGVEVDWGWRWTAGVG